MENGCLQNFCIIADHKPVQRGGGSCKIWVNEPSSNAVLNLHKSLGDLCAAPIFIENILHEISPNTFCLWCNFEIFPPLNTSNIMFVLTFNNFREKRGHNFVMIIIGLAKQQFAYKIIFISMYLL